MPIGIVEILVQAGLAGVAIAALLLIYSLTKSFMKRSRNYHENYIKLSQKIYEDYGEIIEKNTKSMNDVTHVMAEMRLTLEKIDRTMNEIDGSTKENKKLLSDLLMVIQELKIIVKAKSTSLEFRK